MSQRRIDDILSERQRPRNALEALVKRNALRQSLTAQLRAVVPSELAPHCQVADLTGTRLTIHVASAAWATRLRFHMPKVEAALRELGDFAAVEEVRIQTATPRPPLKPDGS